MFLKCIKEILLEIGFIEEMRILEVIKKCPKHFSPILFIRENTNYTPFDSVSICDVAAGMSLQKFFAD